VSTQSIKKSQIIKELPHEHLFFFLVNLTIYQLALPRVASFSIINTITSFMNRHIAFLIILVLLTKFSLVQASETIDVAKVDQAMILLTSHLAIFEDASQVLTLADVQKESIQFKKDLPQSESINLSYTKSAYWLRLSLENNGDKSIDKML
jgi:hypothetical protein